VIDLTQENIIAHGKGILLLFNDASRWSVALSSKCSRKKPIVIKNHIYIAVLRFVFLFTN